MAIVYGINRSVDAGWTSGRTVALLDAGGALLGTSPSSTRRAGSPLMPLSMFRRAHVRRGERRPLLVWGASFAVIFQGTLFMQQALGYSAVSTGVAWLASTMSSLCMVRGGGAAVSSAASGRARRWSSARRSSASGLFLLSRAPADASYWSDLFPGFLAFGVGMGFSMMAIQAAAFSGVDNTIAGVAGGVIETSREIGGALGVAIVATIVVARVEDVLAAGASEQGALTAGFPTGCAGHGRHRLRRSSRRWRPAPPGRAVADPCRR